MVRLSYRDKIRTSKIELIEKFSNYILEFGGDTELIKLLPFIIYQIDDMDNEKNAEKKLFHLLSLTERIRIKGNLYVLYNEIEEKFVESSKNIIVLYEGLLMRFVNKEEKKKVLYYSRVLLQNAKD